MVFGPLSGFHTMSAPTVLRTEEEKVRYFRDALLGDDFRYRIVVGGTGSGKKAAFLQALGAIRQEGIPANQFQYYGKDSNLIFPLANVRSTPGKALYFYPYRTMGPSVVEHLEDEGAENCEVVIFETA